MMPGKRALIAGVAVVVVIVILAIGAVFVYPMLTSGSNTASSGTSGSSGASGSSSSGSSGSASGGTSTTSVLTNTGVASITLIETPAPNIPATGVQVHVNYIGSYDGTYGMPSDLQNVPGPSSQNSGDQIYEVVNATGIVQATFQKEDSSTTHELLVEIYHNGKLLASGNTSDQYGKVTISADTGIAAAATPAAATTIKAGNTAAAVQATTAVTTTTTTAPVASTTT
jgi:hypothetical protein